MSAIADTAEKAQPAPGEAPRGPAESAAPAVPPREAPAAPPARPAAQAVRSATSAAALTRHLTRTEVVTARDTDGSEWAFEVRGVSAAMWDPGHEWYAQALVAGDAKTLGERLAKSVGEPDDAVMRAVLIAGCVQPAISAQPREGSVWVEDLLRRDILARALYAEVARMALENLARVEHA